MNPQILSLAVTVAFLSGAAHLAAKDVQRTVDIHIVAKEKPAAFANSSEAGMMHRAYRILASGDHDYRGHRVKSMAQVKAAADLLGLDLKGDNKDKEAQPLSDDRLREAKGLLQNVLGASAVKGQKRIEKHINEAINQIGVALTVH